MRVDEEKALRSSMEAISAFTKESHTQLWAFFRDVDEINLPSLQQASFESDLVYFKKVSTVLSFILTIAHNPRFVARTIETIVRADQAGTLSNESFQATLRDPALWKQKASGMSPEYVHHTESVDEIEIYENYFVIMVVGMIDRSLHHYEDFYANSIKSVSSSALTLDGDRVLTIFAELHRLFRKLDRVKRTDFYRRLYESYSPLTHIDATNVLKHDRLYNAVYRFYLDLHAYGDERELVADLLGYYYILLLRSLKAKGMKLAPSSNRARTSGKTAFFQTPKETRFFGNGLFLTLTKESNQTLLLTVSLESDRKIVARHLFAVNPKYSFTDFESLARKKKDEVDTVEALSVWALAEIASTSVNVLELGSPNDQQIMDHYLGTKLMVVEGSHPVYREYCPSCRAGDMRSRNDVYTCLKCKTRYALTRIDDKDQVFFLRLRRPN